jgi:hypothetical protein
MKFIRELFVLVAFALLMGIDTVAMAATPLVDLGLSVSDIKMDCGAPARERRYSFVAEWLDPSASGSYYVKNGSQCKLTSDSPGLLASSVQCSTNSYKSCTPRCANGKCRAEFNECLAGRAAYLYVTATDGAAYWGLKFPLPTCQ